jgi:lactam utilization protein B
MTKYDAEARKTKARVVAEGFADRVYADDGQLCLAQARQGTRW